MGKYVNFRQFDYHMDMCRASRGTLAYWNQMILLTQPVLNGSENKCSYKYIDSIINDGHMLWSLEVRILVWHQDSNQTWQSRMDVTEKLRFRVASFQSQGGPSLNYILFFSLYSGSLLESINSFGRCLVKSRDWMKSVQRTFSHKLLYNLVSLPKQKFPPHQQKA